MLWNKILTTITVLLVIWAGISIAINKWEPASNVQSFHGALNSNIPVFSYNSRTYAVVEYTNPIDGNQYEEIKTFTSYPEEDILLWTSDWKEQPFVRTEESDVSPDRELHVFFSVMIIVFFASLSTGSYYFYEWIYDALRLGERKQEREREQRIRKQISKVKVVPSGYKTLVNKVAAEYLHLPSSIKQIATVRKIVDTRLKLEELYFNNTRMFIDYSILHEVTKEFLSLLKLYHRIDDKYITREKLEGEAKFLLDRIEIVLSLEAENTLANHVREKILNIEEVEEKWKAKQEAYEELFGKPSILIGDK